MDKNTPEDLTFEPLSSSIHRLLSGLREKMTETRQVERIAAALEIPSPYHACVFPPDTWQPL